MIRAPLIAVTLFALLACSGCSKGTSVRYFKGVRYEFPADERVLVRQSEVDNVFEFKSLNLNVRVEQQVLTVNGQHFGKVERGNRVEVTRAGKVLINDQARSPRPSP